VSFAENVKEMTELLEVSRGDRRKATAELHRGSSKDRLARRVALKQNRQEVRGSLRESRNERKVMTRKLGQDLKGFLSSLQEEVGSLRRGCQRAQKAAHADLQRGHRIWLEFAKGRA